MIYYIDILFIIEYLIKLWDLFYLFFFKNLYNICIIFLFNINYFLYLIIFIIYDTYIYPYHLLNLEFTYIQIFHILLKFFKTYILIYCLSCIINTYNFKYLKIKYLFIVYMYVLFAYLITGSFWAWLEPTWESWWFGEDLEELFILITFFLFIIALHLKKLNYLLYYSLMLSVLIFLLVYINYFSLLTRHKTLVYYSLPIYYTIFFCLFYKRIFWVLIKKKWFLILFLNSYQFKKVYFYSKQFYFNLNYKYSFEIFYFILFIFFELPIFFKTINFDFNYLKLYFLNFTLININTLITFNVLISLNKFIIHPLYLLFCGSWLLFMVCVLLLNLKPVLKFHLIFIAVLLFSFESILKYSPLAIVEAITFNKKILNFFTWITDLWVYIDSLISFFDLKLLKKIDFLYSIFTWWLVFYFSLKLLK